MLAGVSIVVALVVGIASWRPKHLDYAIVNDIPILWRGAHSFKQSMSVRYDDIELSDPRLVTVRIRNTGKKAIRPEDFDEPVSVSFTKNPPIQARIFEGTSPKFGRAAISRHGQGVHVESLMINPRDWFDIQILSDGPHGNITVQSRIVDARPMKLKMVERLMEPLYLSEPVLYALVGVAFLVGAFFAEQFPNEPVRIYVVTFMALMLFYTVARFARSRQKSFKTFQFLTQSDHTTRTD